MSHLPLWKLVHVLGAVLMLGNVIVTGVWAHLALRLPDEVLARHAARAIWVTDACFTFSGGAAIVVAGIMLGWGEGLAWGATPWLRHGVYGLAASTGVWLVLLLPDQWRLGRAARVGDLAAVRATYRRWSVWGWLAVAPLLYALAEMVLKDTAPF